MLNQYLIKFIFIISMPNLFFAQVSLYKIQGFYRDFCLKPDVGVPFPALVNNRHTKQHQLNYNENGEVAKPS